MTADTFLLSKDAHDFRLSNSGEWLSDFMIEFAKYHVKEALNQASEKAEMVIYSHSAESETISKESILNAYPEENIK